MFNFLKNILIVLVMFSPYYAFGYSDLITIVHPDNTTTGFNSLVNTDISRGTALLDAVAAAENGDSLYLAAGTFDIQNNNISLKKRVTLVTPVFHYGVGAGYNYTANGTGYMYRIYALVDGEWILSYETDELTDNLSGDNLYLSVSWASVPFATEYRINRFNQDQGSWDQYYTTSSTSFNDGDGTEASFLPNDDIQLAPTGFISIHGQGKYDTIIKSSLFGGSYIIQLASGSETTDLSIIATSPDGTYEYPYGDTSEGFVGSLIKNVYISGKSDGIFIANNSLPTTKHLNIINVTVDTTYDVLNWITNQEVYIYNSNLNALQNPADYPGSYARGLSIQGGIVHAFNTSINVQGSIVANIGIPVYSLGTLYMYGGSITTAGTGALDVNNQDSVYFTDSVSYDPLKVSGGPISNIDAIQPVITDNNPTSITATSAVLNAYLLTDGGSEITTEGFLYGLSEDYGSEVSLDGPFSLGDFSTTISDLSCETIYYYRSYAVNIFNITYGTPSSFTTGACSPDTTPPILAEITPVSNPTYDNTPDYTFSSDEEGYITYGGSCSSATTSAMVGDNTITFDSLADGTYSDCTITVTDSSDNQSDPLSVSEFTVTPIVPRTMFWYQTGSDAQWTTLEGNWWDDEAHTVQSSDLPHSVDEVQTLGSIGPEVDLDTWTAPAHLDATNTGINFTSFEENNPGIDINGDAIFYGNSYNNNIISGSATFNEDSFNETSVLGDASFYDNSFNDGTVGGQATFNDSSRNNGTLTGNVIFNDSSTNTWHIIGNALFVGDDANNDPSQGTVSGTKTRKYISPFTTNHDFVIDGPWIVIADGVEVDVSGAQYDTHTTFTPANGGSFVYGTPSLIASYASLDYRTITLFYDKILDLNSTPAPADYSITANSINIPVSSVTVTRSAVILYLSSRIDEGDTVTLDYIPGSNPVKSFKNISAETLTNQSISPLATPVVPAGSNHDHYLEYSVLVGTQLYIANVNDHAIYVVDTTTNTISDRIPVGIRSFYLVTLGHKVYVADSVENVVYIIDTHTNTVIDKVAVGTSPEYIFTISNKIYIVNPLSDNISIVNATTNTVENTISIPLGSHPYALGSVGDKVYVPNVSSQTISVVDPKTDTLIDTIAVPGSSLHYYAVAVGENIYFLNSDGNLLMIDSTTDMLTDTGINLTGNPDFMKTLGTKLYILASTGLYVVDTNNSNSVQFIPITSPLGLTVVGNKIYITSQSPNIVSVVDYATDSIIDTISLNEQGFHPIIVGDKVYITNQVNSFSFVNTNSIPSQLPNLASFTSTTSSGTYTSGQSINITANFGRTLHSGSTMTVGLNTGETVVLNNVSGTALSGTYVIGVGAETPDLAVTEILSANVTDSTSTYNRTQYDLPTSQGSFNAENSFITRNIGDSKNIVIGTYATASTGSNPYQISVPINGRLYVANQGAGTVSVIRISDNTIFNTITVGDEPYGLTYSNGQLYVANTGSDTVSVINPNTNTVTHTISVGVKPYYAEHIGNTVYVTNGASNTVSVINTTSNTVTATIPVGSYPRGIKAHGTDLYVANYGDPNYSGGNYISVIDSLTNEVTDTIILPGGSDGPRGVTVLGSKVYVTNFRSNNVSVINTATNTITDTISVGIGPRGIIGLGTNIYVENFDDGTISVIDTNTNTVSETITVGSSPAGMSISGTDIYITSFQDNKVYILDTLDNTLKPSSDTTAPTLSEITPVTTPTSDSTPDYTFSSDEAGNITYGGSCSSSTTLAVIGNNTITFNSLVDGTYSDCTIIVTDDSNNQSDPLNVTSFTIDTSIIDTTAPVLSSISSNPSTTSVTITWTTDEASSSIIDYGTTSSYGTTTSEADTSPRVTSHSVTITGLTCGTTYHYKVSSTDASSNTGESSDTTFTTSACASSGGGGGGSHYVPIPQVVVPVIPLPVTSIITQNISNLTKTLKLKMIDPEVKNLQVFLNTHGFTLAKNGAGSPGKETNKYGLLTYKAVVKFQKKYGLKDDGVVGKKTRVLINSLQ